MTKPDIEAIRQRCEAATPGPWAITLDLRLIQDKPQLPGQNLFKIMDDLRFIAHARTDIPALLDRLEKLEAIAVLAAKYLNDDCAMYEVELRDALKQLDGGSPCK